MNSELSKLHTVEKFSQIYPAFTKGGLRMYIFKEEINGLKESGAIMRLGTKILIHEDRFLDWVKTSPVTIIQP